MTSSSAAKTLSSATGDAFKSSRLDKMLSNFTNSYKLYWLKSIFDEAVEGNSYATFENDGYRIASFVILPVFVR